MFEINAETPETTKMTEMQALALFSGADFEGIHVQALAGADLGDACGSGLRRPFRVPANAKCP